jgi:hypothetical protein
MNPQEHEALSARVLEEADLMRDRPDEEYDKWFFALSLKERKALARALWMRKNRKTETVA